MAEQRPMGIGNLGFRNLIFKKKFRFTFQLEDICNNQRVPEHYVRLASRPKLSVDETQLDFLNARSWIPSKAYWNEISVTYIDVATADAAPLFSWLASVYNFTDPYRLQQGSQRRDYSARAIIKIWDGCGQLIERWTLRDVWPKEINFGDLDYGSPDNLEIELSMRYSDVLYEPICPAFPINPCCSPCTYTAGQDASNSENTNFVSGGAGRS